MSTNELKQYTGLDPIMRKIANREYDSRERSVSDTLASDIEHSIQYVLQELELYLEMLPKEEVEQAREWLDGVARKMVRELHRSGYTWGFFDGMHYAFGL